MSTQDTGQQPPQPPEFQRRFALYPYQYIAIPLLFVMPILALLGLFGDAARTVETTGEEVTLHVEYSPRQRHGVATSMMILITNQTDAPLEDVTLRLDRAYFEGFTQVSFIPSVEAIAGAEYRVELPPLLPHDEQAVRVDMRAETAGRYSAMVAVEGVNLEPVVITFDSILFP